jgi:hypothetical protein
MFSLKAHRPIYLQGNTMSSELRLVAVVVATALLSGSVPIGAQQPAGIGGAALQGSRAGLHASIQGTAVSSTNTAVINAPVRLRDARLGHIINSVMTDSFGAFEFRNLEPGSYVAELMGPNRDVVLAATPIINVTSDDRPVAVLIKLPFQSPALGGAFGRSLPAVLAITSAAVATGVLATSVAGAPATDRALPGQR